ncbi:MAG: RluA family pseudouridine synthase [Planctomycetes bacterium]|nr:RluA family pseudouridine synthase [Planctomycetota bacterium]
MSKIPRPAPPEKLFKKVNEGESGLTIRQLLKIWTGLPAKQLNLLLDGGLIRVNGKIERFGSRRLLLGDQLEGLPHEDVLCNQSAPSKPSEKDVLYEDHEYLVYNKAAGLPSQRTRDPRRPNLEDMLNSGFREGPQGRLILVHRLDRDTTGALLFAKNEAAAQKAMEWFRQRMIHKTYVAICYGSGRRGERGRWQHRLAPIHKSGGISRYGIVTKGGLSALTDYEILDSLSGYTLLALKPGTGRTHQLRVQLAHAGLPVVGDELYDPEARLRTRSGPHHLHARCLELPTPEGAFLPVTAPYPEHMLQLVKEENLRERFGPAMDGVHKRPSPA